MRYLIRFLTRGPAESIEQRDRVYEGEVITLGRATDQVLHLRDRRVGLRHARIEAHDSGFRITTTGLTGITVNGRSCREAMLEPGARIEIGANELVVIESPQDFDFALTFELKTEASRADLAPRWAAMRLEDVAWSKRRWSWLIAAVVLSVALVLPALSLLDPGVASVLRGSPLPDDGWWLAGSLHAGHSGSSATCTDCHARPFRRVADQACVDCHEVDRHVAAIDRDFAVVGERRCAGCHREHNEPPELVNRDQALCADCHGDAGNLPPETAIGVVTDFLDAHGEFRVSLLAPAPGATGEWASSRHTLEPALQERSNLSFSHAQHLDPEGLVTPEGARILECVDCHRPEAGGARMQAIGMEDTCRGCHALSFDPADPSREVPHGDAPAVLRMLTEFYSARLLSGDSGAGGPTRRRPGQPLTAQDRARVASEAREQARRVARDIFERRICATCHEVTELESGAEMPWRVAPVKLSQAYLPGARFSHADHGTEVTACNRCHAAETSESSADVLIPGIDVCRECHGSALRRRNTADQIQSTCVVCHGFHNVAHGAFTSRPTITGMDPGG